MSDSPGADTYRMDHIQGNTMTTKTLDTSGPDWAVVKGTDSRWRSVNPFLRLASPGWPTREIAHKYANSYRGDVTAVNGFRERYADLFADGNAC